MKKIPNLRVKTTHVGCCGIEDNTEYLAHSEYPVSASYVSILLPNGEWTSYHDNMDRFKIIERLDGADYTFGEAK